MNTYLLMFYHKKKLLTAWYLAKNAGEGINLLEDMGVDVIKTVKLRTEYSEACLPVFPCLLDVIEQIQKSPEYRPI